MINYEVEVTFPSGSSTNKAGVIFCHDGSNSYYAVVLERTGGTDGRVALYQVSSGSWGSPLATGSTGTINDSTAYTVKVMRKQSHIYAEGVGSFTYDSSSLTRHAHFAGWSRSDRVL